jgi:hypothetical protein
LHLLTARPTRRDQIRSVTKGTPSGKTTTSPSVPKSTTSTTGPAGSSWVRRGS